MEKLRNWVIRHQKLLFVAAFLLFAASLVLFDPFVERFFPSFAHEIDRVTNTHQADEYAVVSDQQMKTRGNIEWVDITQDHAYVAYDTGVVDVYDHIGEFQFSIIFRDLINGSFYMRCDNGLAYFLTKTNFVYIFDGEQQVSRMTYEEARDQGFSNEWFREGEDRARLNGGKLEKTDENGILICVKAPTAVISNKENASKGNVISIAATVILFVFFFLRLKPKKRTDL